MGECTRSLFGRLPEHIVHIIFSKVRLTNKDAIQWSLVSKEFFNLVHKRSALILLDKDNIEAYREELRYMKSTLKRYQLENIHLDTLEICNLKLTDDDVGDLNSCIELAAEKGLTNFHLKVFCPRNYVLPEAVFGVESLVQLCLKRCRLQLGTVRLPNLRELYLKSVIITNEGALEKMIKGCPSIETLRIKDSGINYFKVSNLPNLKKLEICIYDDETAEVCASAATNLESICVIQANARDHHRTPHIRLGEHEYPNLKSLELRAPVDGNIFRNFARKFPRLESFYYTLCNRVSKIDIASPSLNKMRFDHVRDEPLEEACFDVPNIVHFDYSQICSNAVKLPKLSFSGGECIPQIKLVECTRDTQDSWVSKHTQFFAQLNTPYEASIEMTFPEVFSNEAYWMTAASVSFPPNGIITGIREFTIKQAYWQQKFSLSFAHAILDTIVRNYKPQTIRFKYLQKPRRDGRSGNPPPFKHNVKCLWNVTNPPTSVCDQILQLLKPRVAEDTSFCAVFNLEHHRINESLKV